MKRFLSMCFFFLWIFRLGRWKCAIFAWHSFCYLFDYVPVWCLCHECWKPHWKPFSKPIETFESSRMIFMNSIMIFRLVQSSSAPAKSQTKSTLMQYFNILNRLAREYVWLSFKRQLHNLISLNSYTICIWRVRRLNKFSTNAAMIEENERSSILLLRFFFFHFNHAHHRTETHLNWLHTVNSNSLLLLLKDGCSIFMIIQTF